MDAFHFRTLVEVFANPAGETSREPERMVNAIGIELEDTCHSRRRTEYARQGGVVKSSPRRGGMHGRGDAQHDVIPKHRGRDQGMWRRAVLFGSSKNSSALRRSRFCQGGGGARYCR